MNFDDGSTILRVARECATYYCREIPHGFHQFKMRFRIDIIRHIENLNYWEKAQMLGEVKELRQIEYGEQLYAWAMRTKNAYEYLLPHAVLWLMWEFIQGRWKEQQLGGEGLPRFDFSSEEYAVC